MNKDIKRKVYFGLAASGLVYAMGGSSVALGAGAAVPSDFDGDGKTDLAVIHPRAQDGDDLQLTWRALLGPFVSKPNVNWGLTTDIVVPGDYDGDGKTDQAIYRPSTSQWWTLDSLTGGQPTRFGIGTDTPVPADYDGDGKTDRAVVRVGAPGSAGVLTWFLLLSANGGQFCSHTFGLPTDIPVPADYDDDASSELAVFRPDTGEWFTVGPNCGSPDVSSFTQVRFGLAGDEPVPGDYDGDGKFDRAVFRPATGTNGTWFVLRSSDGKMQTFVLGLPSDRRVPGDYNGDGKWDFAVYRPGTNPNPNPSKWIIRYNEFPTNVEQPFGNQTDLPVPSAYTFREPLPRRTGF